MADAGGMSKSAKKRANQKARAAVEAAASTAVDAAHAEVQAPHLPTKLQAQENAAPKSKAAAKASPAKAPAAKTQATKTVSDPASQQSSGGQSKAAAKSQTKKPVAAKAQAVPEVQQKEVAAVPVPKATPKSKAGAKAVPKGKAQAKAQQKPATEGAKPARKKTEDEGYINYIIDDGSGPAWEVTDRTSKKQDRRREKEAISTSVAKDEDNFETVTSSRKQRPEVREPKEPQPRSVKQAVIDDIDRILNMKSPEVEKQAKDEEEDDGKVSTTVVVDVKKIGAVKAGLKQLQYKTWTKIDARGPAFTITGEQEWVDKAEVAIKDLEKKGYSAVLYDDFAESFVQVSSRSIPEIIGSQGSVVKKIKEHTGCEIVIPPFNRDQGVTKVRVEIAGEAKKVEMTKTIIENLMKYHHDPTISPDEVHEEMDVEGKNGLLIGHRGSEMRHMQNNFKVTIYIPREDSVSQKVVIVGEAEQVSRCKTYIERLISTHSSTGDNE